jgi:hypothetical protein
MWPFTISLTSDELGIGDLLGQIPAGTQLDVAVSCTMQDQGGNRYGGEQRAKIALEAGPYQVADPIRATGGSCPPGEPGLEAVVGDPAGGDCLHYCTMRKPCQGE